MALERRRTSWLPDWLSERSSALPTDLPVPLWIFKKIVHPPSCLGLLRFITIVIVLLLLHHDVLLRRGWLPHFVTLKCIRRKSKLEFNDIITENCNCAFGIRIRPCISNHEQITLIFPLYYLHYITGSQSQAPLQLLARGREWKNFIRRKLIWILALGLIITS